MELLLAHPGVDEAAANAKDAHGRTPLHEALLHGNFDCACTLLGSPKVLSGDADNNGDNPLHCFLGVAKSIINTEIRGQKYSWIAPRVDGLLRNLLGWKTPNKTPIIDIFAYGDGGLTALDLARELGDRYRETIEDYMHWRVGWKEHSRRREVEEEEEEEEEERCRRGAKRARR